MKSNILKQIEVAILNTPMANRMTHSIFVSKSIDEKLLKETKGLTTNFDDFSSVDKLECMGYTVYVVDSLPDDLFFIGEKHFIS